ncbi:YidH family protein [Oceanobacillus longus]|uniref:YidH family protein n=1 Tax=Oceanobacillus longus TaxID=930120 RepID=A0ABV8GYE7_9BACI
MASKLWNKEKEENQLRVAQQHLANERTYLAWIRTAIAIIGIGFLTISYHLTIGESHRVSDFLAVLISILSGVFGVGVIITAAIQYLRKRKQIQAQSFQSSYLFVLFGSLVLLIVILIAILYILIQFMH